MAAFRTMPEAVAFKLNLKKDALLLTTGSILSLWGTFALKEADSLDGWNLPPFGFERRTENLTSDGAVLASDVLATAVLTPLLITGWQSYHNGNREPFLTDFVMFTETMLVASGLNLLVRSQFHRNRPSIRKSGFTYRPNEAFHSFYSGHTSVGFAAAVYTGYTFRARNPGHAAVPWVWTGALTAASSVGLFRILGGKHYPSDVVVGAAVGALIGWAVPARHRKRPEKTSFLMGPDRITFLWRFP